VSPESMPAAKQVPGKNKTNKANEKIKPIIDSFYIKIITNKNLFFGSSNHPLREKSLS
jgi:hypothetical protein